MMQFLCRLRSIRVSVCPVGPKKKIVCFRSPDRPYFEAPTLNFFFVTKIRFSQVNIFLFSDDYFGSPKRFTDGL